MLEITSKRRRVLGASRDHLVHVLPRLEISGLLEMITTICGSLQKEYQHTLLHETPLLEVDEEVLWVTQASGVDVKQVDYITADDLAADGYTGAILYNVENHPGLGQVIPSMYYSYGLYDPGVAPDIVVPCSEYAAHTDRQGNKLDLDPEWVIPPLVQTRQLRKLSGAKRPFTVAVITSGNYGKYPSRLVIRLLADLPRDIRVLVTRLPKYPHPGVPLALSNEQSKRPMRTITCNVRPTGGVQYVAQADVLVYGTSESYYEPYGRLVVEALAMGKPVICQRKAVFAERLEHGVTALLYDNVEEVLEYVDMLRKDDYKRTQLGANARMWASWEDYTVHVSKLKRILRMIGT